MTHEDVMELTIPVMEEIFEGFDKNQGTSSKSKDVLHDADALRFLIDNGGKL